MHTELELKGLDHLLTQAWRLPDSGDPLVYVVAMLDTARRLSGWNSALAAELETLHDVAVYRHEESMKNI